MPDSLRGLALALIAAAATLSAAQQPQQPDPRVTMDELNKLAEHGNFDEASFSKALEDAGIKGKELADKIKALKDTANEQNSSGKGDWDFGQVYRDRDYKVTYPLDNHCKVGQTVTITYPKSINLTGPTEVAIAPYGHADVEMVLKMTEPPLPSPPYPPGVKLDCYDIAGEMTLVHPKEEQDDGERLYVCNEMQRTHRITMHVHQHSPPTPPGGGGGGPAGKKKKNDAVCDLLWRHDEFFPDAAKRAPDDCRDELRQLAIDFVEQDLKPLSAKDKEKLNWAWVPNRPQLELMSVHELLDVKARADAQVAAGRKK